MQSELMDQPKGWKTYNFEVGEHHTYVADGVRVHNSSWHPNSAVGQALDKIFGSPITVLGWQDMHDGNPAHGHRVEYQGVTYRSNEFGVFKSELDGSLLTNPSGSGNVRVVNPDGSVSWVDHDDSGNENYSSGEWAGGSQISDHPDLDYHAPVIIDLDGDGIEVTASETVFFDLDDDGFEERTSWVAPEDGFLVVDLAADGTSGADGIIDQGKEIAFSAQGEEGDTDLAALKRVYDTNNNGQIDAGDSGWSDFRIWQDTNQDGRTWTDVNGNGVLDAGEDQGELKTLAELGIASINLNYDNGAVHGDVNNAVTVFGSTLFGTASYTKTDGTVIEGGVGDVGWVYNELGFKFEGEGDDAYTLLEALSYHEIQAADSADLDVSTVSEDGIIGDTRANVLDASASDQGVQMTGLAGNDTLLGGASDDMLAGGSGADVLSGGAGNDILFIDDEDLSGGSVHGGSGQDAAIVVGDDAVSLNMANLSLESFVGGVGGDTVHGGSQFYDLSIQGRAGDDLLGGGHSDDVISGDEGNDELHGGAGGDLLIGGEGNDTFYDGAGDDLFIAGNGDDNVHAGAGDDVLYGDDGHDYLSGAAGDDRIYGGEGNDIIHTGLGDDRVDGGAGNDVIYGDFGDDVFHGGEGNDDISTGEGDDILYGGAGDDVLRVTGYGFNYVFGGEGYDIAHFGQSSTVYSAAWMDIAGLGTRFVVYGNNATGGWGMATILIDVEQAQFANGQVTNTTGTGGLHDEYEINPTAQFNQVVNGAGGADVVAGGYGNDAVYGHAGNDQVWGHQGNDELHGWTGDDFLVGGSGNDTIHAQQDNDTVDASSGQDVAYGGEGADAVYGNTGSDQLFGDSGDDLLHGGHGADILSGGQGNDTLVGHWGNDILKGGSDNDTLNGNDGQDILYGDSGDDDLFGDEGSDYLYGGVGQDELYGGLARDWLHGGFGHDDLFGNYGDDLIYGETGHDDLFGEQGRDALFGGGGNDTLHGGQDDDLLNGGYGDDILNGGEGSDILSSGKDLGIWSATQSALSMGGVWATMKFLTGDFDGDGRDDFMKTFNDAGNASMDVHLSGGSSFGIARWATQQGGYWDGQKWLSGDFNGDGRDDVMKVFNDNGNASLDVHASNGSSFGIERWATQQGGYAVDQKWLSGDFNGDGKDDVVNIFDDFNLASIDVHSSTGTGFTMARWNTQFGGFWDSQDWLSGDFNGDGIDDIMKVFVGAETGVTHADVHLSNGSTFSIARWLNVEALDGLVESAWQAADVNGDGLDDLIGFGRGSGGETYVQIYVSEGDGFSHDVWTQEISGHTQWQALIAGDFLGNGKADIAQIWNHSGLSVMTHSLVAGSNVLSGDAGNDTLVSYGGDDNLTGGTGADTFRFVGAFGHNTITDFDVANSHEVIEFVDVVEILGFADLKTNHMTQVGADTVIDDGNGNSITLQNVLSTNLSSDDFVFL